ncbi:MAG: alpha/beta hydrolase [Gemmatimonadota bacterium]|nr:MAG: alpha/beta hydrolase [Gemmatimonadota bacterium]
MNFTRKKYLVRVLKLVLVIILTLGFSQCAKSPTESESLQKRSALVEVEESNFVPTEITTNDCDDGVQPSGALYRICMPNLWNNDLVVWAHGYTDPQEPLSIPDEEIGGFTLSEIVNLLGYAFATTSYRANGLVVPDAVEDLAELVDIFIGDYTAPEHVYLVGASEGGLITALSIEQYPEKFSGGLATCGPVGDFPTQLNYFGDFRTLFNYFFPDVLPGSPVDIPKEIMDYWDSVYEQKVKDAIHRNQNATEQLFRVTGAPFDPWDLTTIEQTVLGALRYNVFATNNAVEKLGGQPFDNSNRIYKGSEDDFQLNRKVQRFRPDQTALDEIEARYQTSGFLDIPLVTLHTTKDEIVPYWHEPRYSWKVFGSGSSSLHTNMSVYRYGHCNFEVEEVLAAFAVLVLYVTTQELVVPEKILADADSRSQFLELAREYGAQPKIVVRSAM